MKKPITSIAAIVMVGLVAQYANAETIPDWIKNNAGWWAEDSISQEDFVSGLQYLIQKGILQIPQTQVTGEKSDQVPAWVKNNAAWWADGTITDSEFVNSVQYLMKIGLITLQTSTPVSEVPLAKTSMNDNSFQTELDACQKITKAYDRIKCEDIVQHKIIVKEYKDKSKVYVAGPITFYFPGAELEIMSSGQPNLSIRLLAENTGASNNIVLMCTGPAICNYDVWDGQKAFKYSATDFTSGQTVVKPGESREINMLFGPNIGYGGTEFVYDPANDYYFRISEPWGSTSIPLDLE
jgi:hypothetical protein